MPAASIRPRVRRRELQAFAERLRELRTARGLSQSDLAGSEFTKGYISQLETGRVGPSVRAARVIAQRLGLQLDELITAPDRTQHITEVALLEAERELIEGSAQKALEAARRVGRTGRSRGRVLRLEGRALIRLERARDAVSVLEAALGAFRTDGDRGGYVRTLHDLAYAHARLDRPQQSLVLLLEAEQALRAGDVVDRTLELEVEAFLASVYARLGDREAAGAHADRAEALAQDVVDHDALAALYGQLGSTEEQRGNYARALEMWRKCLQELEVAGRERLVADTWHTIATVHLRLGDPAKARAALSRAVEMQEELGHSRLAPWITLTRARLALEERKTADAEQFARQAAADPNASAGARGEALLVLAQTVARKKAPDAAVRRAFEDALRALSTEPSGARVRGLKLYADALAQIGDVKGAYERAREALELARPGK